MPVKDNFPKGEGSLLTKEMVENLFSLPKDPPSHGKFIYEPKEILSSEEKEAVREIVKEELEKVRLEEKWMKKG